MIDDKPVGRRFGIADEPPTGPDSKEAPKVAKPSLSKKAPKRPKTEAELKAIEARKREDEQIKEYREMSALGGLKHLGKAAIHGAGAIGQWAIGDEDGEQFDKALSNLNKAGMQAEFNPLATVDFREFFYGDPTDAVSFGDTPDEETARKLVRGEISAADRASYGWQDVILDSAGVAFGAPGLSRAARTGGRSVGKNFAIQAGETIGEHAVRREAAQEAFEGVAERTIASPIRARAAKADREMALIEFDLDKAKAQLAQREMAYNVADPANKKIMEPGLDRLRKEVAVLENSHKNVARRRAMAIGGDIGAQAAGQVALSLASQPMTEAVSEKVREYGGSEGASLLAGLAFGTVAPAGIMAARARNLPADIRKSVAAAEGRGEIAPARMNELQNLAQDIEMRMRDAAEKLDKKHAMVPSNVRKAMLGLPEDLTSRLFAEAGGDNAQFRRLYTEATGKHVDASTMPDSAINYLRDHTKTMSGIADDALTAPAAKGALGYLKSNAAKQADTIRKERGEPAYAMDFEQATEVQSPGVRQASTSNTVKGGTDTGAHPGGRNVHEVNKVSVQAHRVDQIGDSIDGFDSGNQRIHLEGYEKVGRIDDLPEELFVVDVGLEAKNGKLGAVDSGVKGDAPNVSLLNSRGDVELVGRDAHKISLVGNRLDTDSKFRALMRDDADSGRWGHDLTEYRKVEDNMSARRQAILDTIADGKKPTRDMKADASRKAYVEYIAERNSKGVSKGFKKSGTYPIHVMENLAKGGSKVRRAARRHVKIRAVGRDGIPKDALVARKGNEVRVYGDVQSRDLEGSQATDPLRTGSEVNPVTGQNLPERVITSNEPPHPDADLGVHPDPVKQAEIENSDVSPGIAHYGPVEFDPDAELRAPGIDTVPEVAAADIPTGGYGTRIEEETPRGSDWAGNETAIRPQEQATHAPTEASPAIVRGYKSIRDGIKQLLSPGDIQAARPAALAFRSARGLANVFTDAAAKVANREINMMSEARKRWGQGVYTLQRAAQVLTPSEMVDMVARHEGRFNPEDGSRTRIPQVDSENMSAANKTVIMQAIDEMNAPMKEIYVNLTPEEWDTFFNEFYIARNFDIPATLNNQNRLRTQKLVSLEGDRKAQRAFLDEINPKEDNAPRFANLDDFARNSFVDNNDPGSRVFSSWEEMREMYTKGMDEDQIARAAADYIEMGFIGGAEVATGGKGGKSAQFAGRSRTQWGPGDLSFNDYATMHRAGFIAKEQNIVRAAQNKIDSFGSFVQTQNALQTLLNRGHIEKVPAGTKVMSVGTRVDVSDVVRRFFAQKDENAAKHAYYTNPDVARIIRNNTQAGLMGQQNAVGKVGKLWRETNNLTNLFQLSLSSFHFSTMNFETMAQEFNMAFNTFNAAIHGGTVRVGKYNDMGERIGTTRVPVMNETMTGTMSVPRLLGKSLGHAAKSIPLVGIARAAGNIEAKKGPRRSLKRVAKEQGMRLAGEHEGLRERHAVLNTVLRGRRIYDAIDSAFVRMFGGEDKLGSSTFFGSGLQNNPTFLKGEPELMNASSRALMGIGQQIQQAFENGRVGVDAHGNTLWKPLGPQTNFDPVTTRIMTAAIMGNGTFLRPPKEYRLKMTNKLVDASIEVNKALDKNDLDHGITHGVKESAKVLPGMVQAASHALFELTIPRAKMTAFYDMMRWEIQKNPELMKNHDLLQRTAADVIDSVDNRFGQMIYDNLNLNPIFKDVLFMAQRAPGWNWGTKRELFGGLNDLRKLISKVSVNRALRTQTGQRLAAKGGLGKEAQKAVSKWNMHGKNGDPSVDVVGLFGKQKKVKAPQIMEFGGVDDISRRAQYTMVLMTAMPFLYSRLMSYFMTGEIEELPAEGWLDPAAGPMSEITRHIPILNILFSENSRRLTALPNGMVRADGEADRFTFPSYAKDLFAYYNDFLGTLGHKVAPLISILGAYASGHDFFGNMIYDPAASWMTQQGQRFGNSVLTGVAPFSFQTAVDVYSRNGGDIDKTSLVPGWLQMLSNAVTEGDTGMFYADGASTAFGGIINSPLFGQVANPLGLIPVPANSYMRSDKDVYILNQMLQKERGKRISTPQEKRYNDLKTTMRSINAAGKVPSQDLVNRFLEAGGFKAESDLVDIMGKPLADRYAPRLGEKVAKSMGQLNAYQMLNVVRPDNVHKWASNGPEILMKLEEKILKEYGIHKADTTQKVRMSQTYDDLLTAYKLYLQKQQQAQQMQQPDNQVQKGPEPTDRQRRFGG